MSEEKRGKSIEEKNGWPVMSDVERRAIEKIAGSDNSFKDFLCPITRRLMVDPVMADDLHSYDRSALEDLQSKLGDNLRSPFTNQPFTSKAATLLSNVTLKQAIIAFVTKYLSNIKKTQMDEEAEARKEGEALSQVLKEVRQEMVDESETLGKQLEIIAEQKMVVTQLTSERDGFIAENKQLKREKKELEIENQGLANNLKYIAWATGTVVVALAAFVVIPSIFRTSKAKQGELSLGGIIDQASPEPIVNYPEEGTRILEENLVVREVISSKLIQEMPATTPEEKAPNFYISNEELAKNYEKYSKEEKQYYGIVKSDLLALKNKQEKSINIWAVVDVFGRILEINPNNLHVYYWLYELRQKDFLTDTQAKKFNIEGSKQEQLLQVEIIIQKISSPKDKKLSKIAMPQLFKLPLMHFSAEDLAVDCPLNYPRDYPYAELEDKLYKPIKRDFSTVMQNINGGKVPGWVRTFKKQWTDRLKHLLRISDKNPNIWRWIHRFSEENFLDPLDFGIQGSKNEQLVEIERIIREINVDGLFSEVSAAGVPVVESTSSASTTSESSNTCVYYDGYSNLFRKEVCPVDSSNQEIFEQPDVSPAQ